MVIRQRFVRKLEELRDDILKMGIVVEEELKLAMEALETLNIEKAHEVHAMDQQVNQMRFDIEARCFTLLVTQQPAAGDLRRVVSALNIIIDLERMGDQAKGIAKVVPHMLKYPNQSQPPEIKMMGSQVIVMLRQAMQAFAHENVELAKSVSRQDDEVDALYARVFNQVMGFMTETKQPNKVESAYEVLRAARELERYGDLATNIAERTVYMVTGSMEEINVDIDDAAEEPRGDEI